jgi:LmbE family N-acetylglucosaminyl deacetylase
VSRVLAVSPHLDDAAFSAGATLARLADEGRDVVVVTAFTASVSEPSGFALACQLDKGLGPEVDYMALRRAEDERALTALGATPVHLPLPEAPHRGYASAGALFGPARAGDDVAGRLAAALAPHVRTAELVLGPRGVGAHVDHRAVVDALGLLGVRAAAWTDQPYAARARAPRPPEAQRVAVDGTLERKLGACAAYASQLAFQFPDGLRATLGAVGTEDFTGARLPL